MGRVIPFAACVLVSTMASATVLVPAELREIVAGSEVIAYARVVEVRPEWAEGRRWIDTVVTAEVVSYLKGGPEDTITFKVPGGQLGRYRSVFVGAPVFSRGDEAVLFLKPRADDLADVFGVNQGVFRVRVDQRTGQRVVVPPPIMATGSPDRAQPLTRGAIERTPLPFAEFGARVREAMSLPSLSPGKGAR
jgi:hypothetical protein